MLVKLILLSLLVSVMTQFPPFLRLSFYRISHCDGYTLHGRPLSTGCALLGLRPSVGTVNPGDNSGESKLFKLIDTSTGEVTFKPLGNDSTNMKYKAFLPNILHTVTDKLQDLDSKLPYLAFETTFNPTTNPNPVKESIGSASFSGSIIGKIIIFSSNQDLDDFIYENNFENREDPKKKYIFKKTGEDMVIKNIEMGP